MVPSILRNLCWLHIDSKIDLKSNFDEIDNTEDIINFFTE